MKASTKTDYEARIGDALAYLAAHHAEDVSPKELASIACFSLHHFHRVFRGVSGESVMQCLRRLRLEAAAHKLRRSDASVVEVALAVGFESHEGFTRAFKDHFGAPPNEWRKLENARITQLAERTALELPHVETRIFEEASFVHMRHQGSFADVGAVWQTFLERASALGLYYGEEQLVGRYPDDPEITPIGKIRFDVGLLRPRADGARIGEGLREETLPRGAFAVTVHEGSYTTLSETYLKLVGGYFPRTGKPLGEGPCLELYLNLPRDTPEADLRTEVWAPFADV